MLLRACRKRYKTPSLLVLLSSLHFYIFRCTFLNAEYPKEDTYYTHGQLFQYPVGSTVFASLFDRNEIIDICLFPPSLVHILFVKCIHISNLAMWAVAQGHLNHFEPFFAQCI
jgi:hypothetical protein